MKFLLYVFINDSMYSVAPVITTRKSWFSRSARRVVPDLETVKKSLEIVGTAGTAVPGLQPVVETALKIIEYAEVRQNLCLRISMNDVLT